MSDPTQPPRDSFTPGMLESLRATRPWVMFLSIIGFVGVGFMIIGAFAMAALGIFGNAYGSAFLLTMAAVYLVMSVLYFFAAQLLFGYASAIGATATAKTKSFAVERALRAQQSFWKYAAIMTICIIVFSFLMMPVSFVLQSLSTRGSDETGAETDSEKSRNSLLLMLSPREKQKQTMADLRAIATALEARATDTNEYPATMSIDELAALLEPTYIKSMPRRDAWGNPFLYEGVNSREYYLASGGSNDKLERASPAAYEARSGTATQSSSEDIVFANGSFLRYPEGIQSVDRSR